MFKRICIRCNKTFTPKGKYCRLCDKCHKPMVSSNRKKCKSLTLKGKHCKCKALLGEYCLRHFEMYYLTKKKYNKWRKK